MGNNLTGDSLSIPEEHLQRFKEHNNIMRSKIVRILGAFALIGTLIGFASVTAVSAETEMVREDCGPVNGSSGFMFSHTSGISFTVSAPSGCLIGEVDATFMNNHSEHPGNTFFAIGCSAVTAENPGNAHVSNCPVNASSATAGIILGENSSGSSGSISITGNAYRMVEVEVEPTEPDCTVFVDDLSGEEFYLDDRCYDLFPLEEPTPEVDDTEEEEEAPAEEPIVIVEEEEVESEEPVIPTEPTEPDCTVFVDDLSGEEFYLDDRCYDLFPLEEPTPEVDDTEEEEVVTDEVIGDAPVAPAPENTPEVVDSAPEAEEPTEEVIYTTDTTVEAPASPAALPAQVATDVPEEGGSSDGIVFVMLVIMGLAAISRPTRETVKV